MNKKDDNEKIISYVIAAIGVAGAIIAIWGFVVERNDRIEADIQISIRSKVFWEFEPITASINVTDGIKNIDKYKIAVFQRNTNEPEESSHFQFEGLLTKEKSDINGLIWFGSESKGNNESYTVTVMLVKRDVEFKKGDITYSIKSFDYKAIDEITVLRDDKVGILK